MDEIRATIDPQNQRLVMQRFQISLFYSSRFSLPSVLQNNVEIHVNHIQSGLSQIGNLSAFASSLS
jgi:hypothetical protein